MLSWTCKDLVGVGAAFSNDFVKFATEVSDLPLLRADGVRSFGFGVRGSRCLFTLGRGEVSVTPIALSLSGGSLVVTEKSLISSVTLDSEPRDERLVVAVLDLILSGAGISTGGASPLSSTNGSGCVDNHAAILSPLFATGGG